MHSFVCRLKLFLLVRLAHEIPDYESREKETERNDFMHDASPGMQTRRYPGTESPHRQKKEERRTQGGSVAFGHYASQPWLGRLRHGLVHREDERMELGSSPPLALDKDAHEAIPGVEEGPLVPLGGRHLHHKLDVLKKKLETREGQRALFAPSKSVDLEARVVLEKSGEEALPEVMCVLVCTTPLQVFADARKGKRDVHVDESSNSESFRREKNA